MLIMATVTAAITIAFMLGRAWEIRRNLRQRDLARIESGDRFVRGALYWPTSLTDAA